MQDEIVDRLSLRSITSVNAIRSTQFTDTSKFYFEIHFSGEGSPWLLRAYTKVNYIT